MERPPYVIIGGGIAGTTCAEEISRSTITLPIIVISASPIVKYCKNIKKVTRVLENFDVTRTRGDVWARDFANIQIVQGTVTSIDYKECKLTVDVLPRDLEEGEDGKYMSLFRNHFVKIVSSARIEICFSRVCVCTGARAKNLYPKNPAMMVLRDAESIEDFASKLRSAKRIGIVGNGGIAMELVDTLTGDLRSHCKEIVWCVRERYIGSAFVDAKASAFFLNGRKNIVNAGRDRTGSSSVNSSSSSSSSSSMNSSGMDCSGKKEAEDAEACEKQAEAEAAGIAKSVARGLSQHRRTNETTTNTVQGNSLGPHWRDSLLAATAASSPPSPSLASFSSPKVIVEYGVDLVELNAILPLSSLSSSSSSSRRVSCPSRIKLSNGRDYLCDIVICAIGVSPRIEIFDANAEIASSGGVKVNRMMQVLKKNSTTVALSGGRIYAAGDVTHIDPSTFSDTRSDPALWLQLRLWTQARVQGLYAAYCMCDNTDDLTVGGGLAFEIFAHSTSFFGYPIILLGIFNAQNTPVESIVSEFSGSEVAMPTKNSPRDFEVRLRTTPNVEYVKLLLFRGRIVGAILIGEAADDLGTTIENLILSKNHVGHLDILDPDFDLEDFFD